MALSTRKLLVISLALAVALSLISGLWPTPLFGTAVLCGTPYGFLFGWLSRASGTNLTFCGQANSVKIMPFGLLLDILLWFACIASIVLIAWHFISHYRNGKNSEQRTKRITSRMDILLGLLAMIFGLSFAQGLYSTSAPASSIYLFGSITLFPELAGVAEFVIGMLLIAFAALFSNKGIDDKKIALISSILIVIAFALFILTVGLATFG